MRGVATGVSLPCGPPTSGQSTPSSCVRTRIPPYAKDGSRKVAVRSGRVTSEWKSARTWKEGAAPAANQKEAPRERRDCVPFRAVPERGQESQWGSCRWSSLDLPYERGGSDGGGEGGSGGAGAGAGSGTACCSPVVGGGGSFTPFWNSTHWASASGGGKTGARAIYVLLLGNLAAGNSTDDTSSESRSKA